MKMFRRCSGDDRGSLPMALFVTSIGLALSVALLPVIIRQIEYTRSFTDRSASLNGAQIGLDVVMARVRAASEVDDDDVIGRLEDMPPCNIDGDAGVDGTGEKLLYTVTITYFDADGKKIEDCDPLTELPFSAKVESRGTNSSDVKRTLTAKYTFWNENDNIPGGAIKVSSPTDKPLCMDSTTMPPAANTQLIMKRCNGGATQLFGYTEELYLKLINSESPASEFGMCLRPNDPHGNNVIVAFQKCPNPADTTPTRFYQWSLDGSSRFHSTNANAGIENFCMHVDLANTDGSKVFTTTCGNVGTQDIWRSDASVGAGMAGDKTSQLVNFAQFSRCLDVTNQDPTASYMIAWFCKQSPNAKVDWNQIWVHPSPVSPEISKTGTIEVTKSGTTYCLKTPTSKTAIGPNPYVTTTSCGTRTADNIRWTVFHDTGVYATSYVIKDSNGFCLQPSDLNATPKEVHGDGTSKIKMAVCSKSELQKWNAPANLNKLTPISGVEEK